MTGQRRRLGKRALSFFTRVEDGAAALYVPTIVLVELGEAVRALYAIPERGDRLIAATAAELDLPLITRDPEIAEAAGVDLLW